MALLQGALNEREEDGAPAGADLLRAFTSRALDLLRQTGATAFHPAAATEVAAVARATRETRVLRRVLPKPACKFLSACAEEGCGKQHTAVGAFLVPLLIPSGALHWCAAHKRWHADARGHMCMLGRWLVDPGVGAVGLKAAGYDPFILKTYGVTCDVMKVGGFSSNELAKAGYAWADLQANFTVQELREQGYSLVQLRAGGFSAFDLHGGGFSKVELLKLGIPEWEIVAKPKGGGS